MSFRRPVGLQFDTVMLTSYVNYVTISAAHVLSYLALLHD